MPAGGTHQQRIFIYFLFTMAKARFCKGLRRGSTKTETYSTLATRKDGRIQIIKDRVTDISNPQSDSQMRNRVIFATVTQAAALMASLITISREGVTKADFARQEFISENTKFLKSVAGRRVGTNLHYLAAFAPKNNTQLIPNGYIVSKGSLALPSILVPKTTGNKGAFGAGTFDEIGTLHGLPFGKYTIAELWSLLFGLQPGDQLTFPQIYGSGIAQAMYDGVEQSDANLVDKTLVTSFMAPRLVLKSEMPADEITISGSTTAAALIAELEYGIDSEHTFEGLDVSFLKGIAIDDTADDVLSLVNNDTYGEACGIGTVDNLRAIGCILSRKDASGIWRYSTTQLICVWDFLGQNSGANYFGFTLENAIATYMKGMKTDSDGNFLQRGGEEDVVPPFA